MMAFLLPSSVSAFWVPQVDICEIEAPSLRENPPCSLNDDGEENNVCLEAAAFPISTTASLLKMVEKWNTEKRKNAGEEILKHIAEVAISLANTDDEFATETIFSLPIKEHQPVRSCSASNLADCEFVPPTPILQLISSAAFANVDTLNLYWTSSVELIEKDVHQHSYHFSHEDWRSLPATPPPRMASLR